MLMELPDGRVKGFSVQCPKCISLRYDAAATAAAATPALRCGQPWYHEVMSDPCSSTGRSSTCHDQPPSHPCAQQASSLAALQQGIQVLAARRTSEWRDSVHGPPSAQWLAYPGTDDRRVWSVSAYIFARLYVCTHTQQLWRTRVSTTTSPGSVRAAQNSRR